MKKKRNANIELARLIACIIIVACHSFYSIILPNTGEFRIAFLRCVFSDGVAIFWIISGFFLFRKQYTDTLIHTLKRIGLPLLIYSVVFFYIGRIFIYNIPLSESLYHSADEYLDILKHVLSFSNGVEGIGQTWYMWLYLFIVIFLYPVIKPFIDKLNDSPKSQVLFAIISGILIILNDISSNAMLEVEHRGIRGAFFAVIFMIWGHIIYFNKDKIFKKWCIPVCIVAFSLINILRAFILYLVNDILGGDNVIHWYTSFGLISAFCIVGFCLSIKTIDGIMGNVIRFLGAQTLNIYIFHGFSMSILVNYGYYDSIKDLIYSRFSSFTADMLYLITIICFVFFLSLIASILVNLIIILIKLLVSYCRKRSAE